MSDPAGLITRGTSDLSMARVAAATAASMAELKTENGLRRIYVKRIERTSTGTKLLANIAADVVKTILMIRPRIA